MVPHGDHLVVELSADFSGLLARTTKSKLVMVAGVGFEPTTFGL